MKSGWAAKSGRYVFHLIYCRNFVLTWVSFYISFFFFSSFVVCKECQAGLATIHEPECLVFRQHQPEKLKVELDSTMPSPIYSLVVPLRVLSLREKDPARWKLALTLTSHLEESPNPNDKCQFIWATGMPILERCGMNEADRVMMAHLMGILW